MHDFDAQGEQNSDGYSPNMHLGFGLMREMKI